MSHIFLDHGPKPEGNLKSTWWLWFESSGDEAAYLHQQAMSRSIHTKAVSALLVAFAVVSAALPGDDFGDSSSLVVLIAVRIIPAIALLFAALMRLPIRSAWHLVAGLLFALIIASTGIVVLTCLESSDAATNPTCGASQTSGFPAFLPFAALFITPYVLSAGLGVRWVETLAFSIVSAGAVLGTSLTKLDGDSIGQTVALSVIVLVLGIVNTRELEFAQRAAFKAGIASDRQLKSLVEDSVTRMVHTESQQRLNELVKQVPALVSELDTQGVIQFVSPASTSLLGVPPEDMLSADSLQFVHPDDQRKAKNALKKALAAAQASDGSAGLPNAKHAYARALIRRRRSNPNGTASWVNLEMHVFVVDRPGREAALLTIERLAAFAEVAAAQANERDEDGVHSPSPHEGTVGTAVFDPQADRNVAFALAYAALVGRILPLGLEDVSGALQKQRIAESSVLLEDVVASLMGAVRCKAHTLPMLNVQEIDILHMVDVCVATTRTLAPQVSLEVHSDTSVPRSITCDSAKSRAALLALLVGTFRREGASQLGQTAVVLVRSVVPKPNAPPSIIRIELQVLGAPGSQSAITTRQLSTDLQLDPLTDVMAPPARVSKDVSQLDTLQATPKLHKYTLGTARHLALAMGGNMGVSQGAPALSDPTGVTFWLHVPVTTQPRAFIAGPNAQPLSLLRQRITSAALPRLAKDPFTPHDVPVRKVPEGSSPAPATGAAQGAAAAAAPAPAAAAGRGGRQLPPNIQNLGKHILFVDDEQVNRRLGSRMMQRLGCTYTLLTDGDEVAASLQAAAAEKPYDMIIIDIVMQRTDGAVVCSQLRNAGVNMPIIAMTGNTGARDVKRFLAAGFDMMLAKPFDILGLGRAIVEAPARRERTLARAAQQQAAASQQQAAAQAAGVEMSAAE